MPDGRGLKIKGLTLGCYLLQCAWYLKVEYRWQDWRHLSQQNGRKMYCFDAGSW